MRHAQRSIISNMDNDEEYTDHNGLAPTGFPRADRRDEG